MADNLDFDSGYDAEVSWNKGEQATHTKLNNWADMVEESVAKSNRAIGDLYFTKQVNIPNLVASLSQAIGQLDLISPPFVPVKDPVSGAWLAEYTITLTSTNEGTREVELPFPPVTPDFGGGEDWDDIFTCLQTTALDPTKHVADINSFTGDPGEWTLADSSTSGTNSKLLITAIGFDCSSDVEITYRCELNHPLFDGNSFLNAYPSLPQLNTLYSWLDSQGYDTYNLAVAATTIAGSIPGWKLTLPKHIVPSDISQNTDVFDTSPSGIALQSTMVAVATLPDWTLSIPGVTVHEDVFPDGVFFLWDNDTEALVFDANGNRPTFYRGSALNDTFELYVSGDGLSLTEVLADGEQGKYSLIVLGTSITKAIRAVADFANTLEHSTKGKLISHASIKDCLPATSQSDELKYGPSTIEGNFHPGSLHRDGYTAGDVANTNNTMKGHILFDSETNSGSDTVPDRINLDDNSYGIAFGQLPAGSGSGFKGKRQVDEVDGVTVDYRIGVAGHLDGDHPNDARSYKAGLKNFSGANFIPDIVVTSRSHAPAAGNPNYTGGTRVFSTLADALDFANASTTARSIYLEPGVHVVSTNISMDNLSSRGLHIRGGGVQATVVAFTAKKTWTVATNNCSIRDLTILNNDINYATDPLLIINNGVQNFLLENVWLTTSTPASYEFPKTTVGSSTWQIIFKNVIAYPLSSTSTFVDSDSLDIKFEDVRVFTNALGQGGIIEAGTATDGTNSTLNRCRLHTVRWTGGTLRVSESSLMKIYSTIITGLSGATEVHVKNSYVSEFDMASNGIQYFIEGLDSNGGFVLAGIDELWLSNSLITNTASWNGPSKLTGSKFATLNISGAADNHILSGIEVADLTFNDTDSDSLINISGLVVTGSLTFGTAGKIVASNLSCYDGASYTNIGITSAAGSYFNNVICGSFTQAAGSYGKYSNIRATSFALTDAAEAKISNIAAATFYLSNCDDSVITNAVISNLTLTGSSRLSFENCQIDLSDVASYDFPNYCRISNSAINIATSATTTGANAKWTNCRITADGAGDILYINGGTQIANSSCVANVSLRTGAGTPTDINITGCKIDSLVLDTSTNISISDCSIETANAFSWKASRLSVTNCKIGTAVTIYVDADIVLISNCRIGGQVTINGTNVSLCNNYIEGAVTFDGVTANTEMGAKISNNYINGNVTVGTATANVDVVLGKIHIIGNEIIGYIRMVHIIDANPNEGRIEMITSVVHGNSVKSATEIDDADGTQDRSIIIRQDNGLGDFAEVTDCAVIGNILKTTVMLATGLSGLSDDSSVSLNVENVGSF